MMIRISENNKTIHIIISVSIIISHAFFWLILFLLMGEHSCITAVLASMRLIK